MVPETLAVVQLECGGLDEGEESSADVAVEGWEGRCWKGNIGLWSGCSCSCVGGVEKEGAGRLLGSSSWADVAPDGLTCAHTPIAKHIFSHSCSLSRPLFLSLARALLLQHSRCGGLARSRGRALSQHFDCLPLSLSTARSMRRLGSRFISSSRCLG